MASNPDPTPHATSQPQQVPPAAIPAVPPEEGVVFSCEGDELVGILHPTASGAGVGVLVVVGGPQYRVGSHRQFVLLARHLAGAGIPVLRFDYRGMGESAGARRDFSQVDVDIAAAVDAFFGAVTGLRRVVLWGLCDAATAAALYAPSDDRVAGLVLLNPWVHTVQEAAQTHLRHYDRRRLLQSEFWRKLIGLRFDWRQSWHSFRNLVRHSGWLRWRGDGRRPAADRPLPEQMAEALETFDGQLCVVLSGNDLTAAEFEDRIGASQQWQAIMRRPTVRRHVVREADHTFSRRVWRDQVAQWTLDWLRESWSEFMARADARSRAD